MSNKLVKRQTPRKTLRCVYLRQRGFYQFFFEENGVTHYPILHEPFLNFIGHRWKKTIEKLTDELKEYGINKKDIENALIQASREAQIRPPKYLR